jgi:hypothetical protein
MKLIDTYSEREYSLMDLKAHYLRFKAEEPWNHCEDFRVELFEILMASVNGRNDLDIIGLTNREVSEYMARLRKSL